MACDLVEDHDLGDFHHNKLQRNDRSKFTGGRTLLTGVHEKGPSMQRTTYTHYEREGHEIENCRTFLEKPLEKTKEFVLYKKLCFGCLGTGHMFRRCKQRKRCKFCDKMHPSSLHGRDSAKGHSLFSQAISSGTTFESSHGNF